MWATLGTTGGQRVKFDTMLWTRQVVKSGSQNKRKKYQNSSSADGQNFEKFQNKYGFFRGAGWKHGVSLQVGLIKGKKRRHSQQFLYKTIIAIVINLNWYLSFSEKRVRFSPAGLIPFLTILALRGGWSGGDRQQNKELKYQVWPYQILISLKIRKSKLNDNAVYILIFNFWY